ncbi:MAG: DUF1576 domain-containing protein [Oscillospiraceae bacterium]|nr:DUF1576 domain-containing protein [Oscillospiraceae bacterium]
MKKLNNLSEASFLKAFFAAISLIFIVAAFCMPDLKDLVAGTEIIWKYPCKVTSNYFYMGGFAATFLNMGLVGVFCTMLFLLPGAKANNASTLGFLLTVGFGAWGINPLNMIPTILGVCLYCLVKKEALGSQANAMMFSTGIAPIISELLFRYPGTEYIGFNWLGAVLAIFVGLIIGFFLPAGLAHAPNIHKGYNHYSAAVPIGFTAYFLRVVLYKVMLGVGIGGMGAYETYTGAHVDYFLGCNVFCLVLFVLCIVVALLMGCTPKDYWNLLKEPGQGVSITSKYGNAAFLMNVGVYGLMIVAYYNLAAFMDGGVARMETVWTGMTFGIVFCMLCTCNSGSHPGNVWPIMLGYVVTAYLFGWISGLMGVENYGMTIANQGILIGLCYANGLSPISGKYGWGYGALAASLHYLLVTAVPDMHGGFCLYNGGFTAALICLLFVPQLEKFCKTKEERKLGKANK